MYTNYAMGKLKTLIVKQHMDATAPRQSFKWQPGIEKEVLSEFKGKTSTWETFCYFQADLLIIPTVVNSPWLQTVMNIPGYVDEMQSTTFDVMDIRTFPLDEYDFVLTHDPILYPFINELKSKYPNVLFGYILAEHSSWQMHSLGFEYDLYLDHTANSADKIVRLPQAINFIYPRIPDVISSIFNNDKLYVYIDYRTVGHIYTAGNNNASLTPEIYDEYINLFQQNLNLTVVKSNGKALTPYMFERGSDSDSIEYYQNLANSKYFISIANRIGQAAYDAASAGALVIGNKNSKLHTLLCHADLLVDNDVTIDYICDLINKIDNDKSLYEKYINYQKTNLHDICEVRPRKLIYDAIKLKRNNNYGNSSIFH